MKANQIRRAMLGLMALTALVVASEPGQAQQGQPGGAAGAPGAAGGAQGGQPGAAGAGRGGAAGGAAAAGRGGGAPAGPRAPKFPGAVFNDSVSNGANYATATFRMWIPDGLTTVRGIVMLNPGSNGDARNDTADSTWEAFAIKNRLALLGTSIQDKRDSTQRDQVMRTSTVFEDYVMMGKGSGQAIINAVDKFARESRHAELATAPFLLWGMSAGGEVGYEFNAWKPERVAAWVANKGGIYYTATVPRAARENPGLLFIGGKDYDSRQAIITGLFELNRRAGALWALSNEREVGHAVGKSQAIAMMFYEDMLAARVDGVPKDANGFPMLKKLTEESGLIGNITTFEVTPAGKTSNTSLSTAWLPNQRIGNAWRAIETGQPLPLP